MGLRTWLHEKTGINFRKTKDHIKALETQIKKLENYVPKTDYSYKVKDEFQSFKGGNAALQKLIEEYKFNTVLDIGAGDMQHSKAFAKHGKQVTAVDYGTSAYFQEYVSDEGYVFNKILGDFNEIEFEQTYDCIWASHVLEHITDVNSFLAKIHSITHEGSIIAITVPFLSHNILGGHVSVWNAGLIMYRLVLAGFDCSSASILAYQAQRWDNISVIIRKRTIHPEGIVSDVGDIRKIKHFLPENLDFRSNERDDPFDGNISRLNW